MAQTTTLTQFDDIRLAGGTVVEIHDRDVSLRIGEQTVRVKHAEVDTLADMAAVASDSLASRPLQAPGPTEIAAYRQAEADRALLAKVSQLSLEDLQRAVVLRTA